MLIHTFSNEDTLHRYKKNLTLQFAGPRNVLSTSAFHGGYHDDFTCIFNFDEKAEADNQCAMKANTYEKHLEQVAIELGLNPDTCTGLSTAADMENLVMKEQSFVLADSSNLTVTAIVTGGIDKNGARPGDPACWQEIDGNYYPVTPGTINIFLHIDANLTPGAMARSIVTCTEAKTAAAEELLCPSLFSSGIATGSGTDGVIIITNPISPIHLTAAGKDSKLGEMIGTTVKKATREALGRQTGVTAAYQHYVINRLSRFGLTKDFIYQTWMEQSHYNLSQDDLLHHLEPFLVSGLWVGKASFLAHLLDQIEWKMLSLSDGAKLIPVLFPDYDKNFTEADWNTPALLRLFCQSLMKEAFPEEF